MNANKLTINAAKTHAMVFSHNINNSNENILLIMLWMPYNNIKDSKVPSIHY